MRVWGDCRRFKPRLSAQIAAVERQKNGFFSTFRLTPPPDKGYNTRLFNDVPKDATGDRGILMQAVIKTGGKQYRVSQGDKIRVETLRAEVGAAVQFDRVLMLADGENSVVGAPTVAAAKVTAKVVEHGRGDKVHIIKFKRRKGYLRRQGHRQNYTEVEITGIAGARAKAAVKTATKTRTETEPKAAVKSKTTAKAAAKTETAKAKTKPVTKAEAKTKAKTEAKVKSKAKPKEQ